MDIIGDNQVLFTQEEINLYFSISVESLMQRHLCHIFLELGNCNTASKLRNERNKH